MNKVNLISKYIDNPFFRFLFRNIFYPFHFFDFRKLIESKIVFNYLDLKKNDVVCDIGCGCGEYYLKMLKKKTKVYGVDINKKAVEIAKIITNNKDNFSIADAKKLPLKSEFFDKVTLICTLEHIEDNEKVLREINRILKQSGIFVLTVDSFTYPYIEKSLLEKHKRENFVNNYYSMPELKTDIEANGFNILKSKYFMTSGISSFLFKLGIINFWVIFIFFPIFYILSLFSDYLIGEKNYGYLLAIKCIKI